MYGHSLSGSRVGLRAPASSDAPALASFWADTAVTRTTGRQLAVSLAQEQAWISSSGDDPAQVVWTVEHDGQVAGTIALTRIDWIAARAQLGILLGVMDERRCGIAREAIELVAGYAFAELNLHKLAARVPCDDRALLEALPLTGFQTIGVLRDEQYRDGQWQSVTLAERVRTDDLE